MDASSEQINHQSEVNILENENEVLKNELERVHTLLTHAQTERDVNEKRFHEISDQMINLMDDDDDEDEVVNSTGKSAISRVEVLSQNLELRNKFIELQSTYKRQLNSYEHKQSELMGDVDALRSQVGRFKDKCDRLESELCTRTEVLDSTAMDAQHNLETANSNLANLVKCLEDEKASSADLQNVARELRKQLDTSTSVNKEQSDEILLLGTALKNIKQELDSREIEFSREKESFSESFHKEHRNKMELWKDFKHFQREFNGVKSDTHRDLSSMKHHLSFISQQLSSALFGFISNISPDINKSLSAEDIRAQIENEFSKLAAHEKDKADLYGRIREHSAQIERLNLLVIEKNKTISALEESLHSQKVQYDEEFQNVNDMKESLSVFWSCIRGVAQLTVENADQSDSSFLRSSQPYFSNLSANSNFLNSTHHSVRHSKEMTESTLSAVQKVFSRKAHEIKNLEMKITSAEEVNRKLEKTRNEFEQEQKHLFHERSEIIDKNRSLNHKLENANEQIRSLQAKAEQMHEEITEFKSSNNALKSEMNLLKINLRNTEEERKNVQMRLDEAVSNLDVLHQSHENLSSNYQNKMKENTILENKLQKNEREITNCKEKIVVFNKQIQSLNDDKAAMKSKILNMEKQYADLEEQKMDCDSCKAKLENQIEDLDSEIEMFKQNKLELENDMTQLKKENSNLHTENQQLDMKKKKLENLLNESEASKAEIQNKYGDLKAKTDASQLESESKIKELSLSLQDHAKVQVDFAALKRQHDAAHKRLKKCEDELEMKESQVGKIQEVKNSLAEKCSQLEQETLTLKSECQQYAQSAEDLKMAKDDSESLLLKNHQEKLALEKKVETLNEKISLIVRDKNKFNDEGVKLKDKLEVSEANVERMKEENEKNVLRIKREQDLLLSNIKAEHDLEVKKARNEKEKSISNLETSHKSQVDHLMNENEENRKLLESENKKLRLENETIKNDYNSRLKLSESDKLQKMKSIQEKLDNVSLELNKQKFANNELFEVHEKEKREAVEERHKAGSKIALLEDKLANTEQRFNQSSLEHEKKMKELNDVVTHLIKENEEIEQLIDQKNNELKTYVDSLNRAEEKINQLSTSLKDANDKRQSSESELFKANEIAASQQQNINTLSNNLECCEKELCKAEQDLSCAVESLEVSEKRLKSLENAKKVVENELDKFKEALREVEKNRLHLKKELMNVKQKNLLLTDDYHNQSSELIEVKSLRAQDQNSEDMAQRDLRMLKQKLLEQEAMCEASQKEINNYKSKLTDVENKLSLKCKDLEHSLNESLLAEEISEKERKMVERQMKDAIEHNCELQLELSAAKGKMAAVTSNYEILEDAKKILEAKISDYHNVLKSTLGVSIIHPGTSPNTSFNLNADTLRIALTDFNNRLTLAESQKEKWKLQVEELQNQIRLIDQEKSRLFNNLSQAKQTISELKNVNRSLDNQLQAAKSSLFTNESTMKGLNKQNSILQDQLSKIEDQLTSSNSKITFQKDTISKLKKVEQKLRDEVSDQRQAKHKAEAVITDLQITNEALQEQINNSEMALNDKLTELKVTKDRVTSLNKQNRSLEERNMSLEISVERLGVALDESTAGQSRLKDQVMDLNKSLSEKSSSSSDLNVKLKVLKSTLKESEENRVSLHKELESSRKNVAELEKQQNDRKGEIDQLKLDVQLKGSLIQDLQSDQSNAHKVLEKRQENEQALLQKIREVRKENEELWNKLADVQHQLKSSEMEKKFVQKSQSLLKKDKNILKKTINQFEKDKIVNMNNSLPDELEKLDMMRKNQNLKAKLEELEKSYSQKIASINANHKQEFDLLNKRLQLSQKHSENLLESREQAHTQRVISLEDQNQMLREQLKEEMQRKRLLLSRTLAAGQDVQDIRTALHSSLHNVSSSFDSSVIKQESQRLDDTIHYHLKNSNIATPSSFKFDSSKSKLTSPELRGRLHSTPHSNRPSKSSRAKLSK